MYEWRTLRAWASFLLCLPLVHFTYMVTGDMRALLDPSPSVWDKEMAAYIERDMETALPDHPVVVVGGHEVRLWQDLPSRLAPRDILMRPLGGATLEDLAYHFDRLVAFYQPAALVIVPSLGDLHLRDDKTADDYVRALDTLLDLDSDYGASHWRYVLSPICTPLHPHDEERVQAMVAAGQALAARESAVTFIDPNPILAGSDGKPNPAYFRIDGLNLNEDGYTRLSMVLREAMNSRGET